ncbi:hypothetical protein ACHQM5_018662 [Ranunculus cassubicifolius]
MKKSSSSSSISSISSNEQLLPLPPPNPILRRTRRTVKPQKNRNGAPSSPVKRSSIYRGVTRHRWTGRFEAHLWDKFSINNNKKKGKQVYLGAYDDEKAAAHTYDLAALKFWGSTTFLNFPLDTYLQEYEEMQNMTKEEYLATLRRRSSGFSRGLSKYRGVARHHHNGRWEARIGRVYGNKYLYLGTYSTQEEAAVAYDLAAIEYRGVNAVTNFNINNYITNPKQENGSSPSPPQPTLPPPPPSPEQPSLPPASPTEPTSVITQSNSQDMVSYEETATPEVLDPEVESAPLMDPALDLYDEWSLCMDNVPDTVPEQFDSLTYPVDEKPNDEFMDIFNDDVFGQNIDHLFEGGVQGKEFDWSDFLNELGESEGTMVAPKEEQMETMMDVKV